MNKELKHRASITTVYWENVRKDVGKVNPELAKIIDSLSPTKKFPLYKAKYPFGAKIIHEGDLYLPTESGEVVSANSAKAPQKILANLQRREIPTILMLKNGAEMFYEMPDRIISGYVVQPGNFIGLWNQFDPKDAPYVKWIWSLVSGARTLYLLPKTTNAKGHKALRRKYGVQSHIPKDYPEQWNIFTEIANSQNFEEEWHSEMLFFSDAWFDAPIKDMTWKPLGDYLIKEAWRDSSYWRNQNIFELVWENFIYEVMDKNIRPNLYLAYIVKQLILIGTGVLPGLTVSIDDSTAPIASLQKAYIKDYQLRKLAL